MSEEATVKKAFYNIAEGRRSVGNPRKRWLEDAENDLKKMGVKRVEKNSQGQKCMENDPEGGQGPTWTVEAVERKRDRESLLIV